MDVGHFEEEVGGGEASDGAKTKTTKYNQHQPLWPRSKWRGSVLTPARVDAEAEETMVERGGEAGMASSGMMSMRRSSRRKCS